MEQEKINQISPATVALWGFCGPSGAVVDSDVAAVAVARAKTAFMTTAIIQDVLRSGTNCPAGERFCAGAVGRIHHVTVSDAKLSPIGISRSGVDVVSSSLAVGNAGGEGGALAARARSKGKQRNVTGLRKAQDGRGLLGSYLYE